MSRPTYSHPRSPIPLLYTFYPFYTASIPHSPFPIPLFYTFYTAIIPIAASVLVSLDRTDDGKRDKCSPDRAPHRGKRFRRPPHRPPKTRARA